MSEPPPEKPADKKPTVVLPQKRLSGKAVLPTMSVERFLREFSSLEITLLAGKEGLSTQSTRSIPTHLLRENASQFPYGNEPYKEIYEEPIKQVSHTRGAYCLCVVSSSR